jgi:hypothetical protein
MKTSAPAVNQDQGIHCIILLAINIFDEAPCEWSLILEQSTRKEVYIKGRFFYLLPTSPSQLSCKT